MRILAVAAFSVPYIRDNWGEPLKRRYGDDVVCVDANPFLALYSGRYLEQYLYRLVARDEFDYLFFYHDWIFSDFSDEFFVNLRHAGVRSVAFHPDDEPEIWYGKNILYDHRYDLIASHSLEGTKRRAKDGFDWKVLYLPWGYNPRLFSPEPREEKRYDVVFIGKNKTYEHDDAFYREDGRNRDEALSLLAQVCEERGWVFRLFGFGWDRHPTLHAYAGGLLSNDEMVRVYRQTRIVFNPAWSSDDRHRIPQTKLRHFEVPGCGAFQLTNFNPELAELLVPGEEVAFYESDEDLVEKVAYFLCNDDAREEIARRGHQRVLSEHTLDHRLVTLFAEMAKYWPPKSQSDAPPAHLPVRQFWIRDREEGARLLERLQAEPGLLSGDAWVHFLAGRFERAQCEYGALAPLWGRSDFPVLGVRSFVELAGRAVNDIQPTREEIRGEFLLEEIHWDDLQRQCRDAIRSSLVIVEDDVCAHALSDFVCAPGQAQALLSAFVSETPEDLRALRSFYSGVVVGQFAIPAGAPLSEQEIGPPYIQRLRRLFAKAVRLGWRVAIYGARGEMARWALSTAFEFSDLQLTAVIDNGMIGEMVQGVPVIGSDGLEPLLPELLVIAAAYSGPQMYEGVRHLEGRINIVPLYDRFDAAWLTLLP